MEAVNRSEGLSPLLHSQMLLNAYFHLAVSDMYAVGYHGDSQHTVQKEEILRQVLDMHTEGLGISSP